MDELRERAEALARRGYDIQVLCLPCDSQNGRCLYKARSPELGCEAVGKTIPEVLDLIRVVRVEYIYGLLEEGRPVPDPNPVFGPRPRGEDVREVAYVITSLREDDCGEITRSMAERRRRERAGITAEKNDSDGDN